MVYLYAYIALVLVDVLPHGRISTINDIIPYMKRYNVHVKRKILNSSM